jgi:RimJ/RimL family protein N-acetyltransferase
MLVGKEVCLGPVLQDDGPTFFGWINSLDLARDNGPYRPTDQAKFNEWFVGIGADPARVVFAIRRRGDLRLLGYLQIVNIQLAARSAELGVIIGEPTDQGQGFGQEAIGMALDFCWCDLNLQRLTLFVVGDNPRALHVYGKAGFGIEGVMRRAAYVDGQFRDITIMATLRPEAETAGVS